jgi:hypothetical protein
MPIILECQECGKEISVKPSRAKDKKFCSRECKNKSGRIELTCLNCKNIFNKILYRSDAIYCSRKCKTEYGSNKFNCKKCGKQFSRGKAYLGAAKFCSMECRKKEGCQGTKNCQKCGNKFSWQRAKDRVEPKFCSLKCRGHTGFRPGGQLYISEMTEEQKLERLKISFEKHVIRKEGCWSWAGPIAHGGYPVMSCDKNLGSDRGHRASWIIHKSAIPKGLYVCHKCDNPICTNPNHLWLGTAKENNDDKIAKCRQANTVPPHKRGEENGSAKLNEIQVKEIRILLEKGLTSRAIGMQYGVSKTTILRIKNGKNWKHIEAPCKRML